MFEVRRGTLLALGLAVGKTDHGGGSGSRSPRATKHKALICGKGARDLKYIQYAIVPFVA